MISGMAQTRRAWLPWIIVGTAIAAGLAVWLARPDADGPRVVASDSTRAGWQRLTYDDVQVEIPDDWTHQDGDACPGALEHWGQTTTEPCARRPGVTFHDPSLDDPADEPLTVVHHPRSRSWSGYVVVAGVVISVQADDRAVVTDVLASAEAPGFQPIQ